MKLCPFLEDFHANESEITSQRHVVFLHACILKGKQAENGDSLMQKMPPSLLFEMLEKVKRILNLGTQF